VYTLCDGLARQGTETQLFFGAASRTAAIGCGLHDFDGMALTLTATTDDGSLGERGFVTAPLERYLRDRGPRPGKES